MRIAGSYLDGKSSRCEDAHLEVSAGDMQIISLFVNSATGNFRKELKFEYDELKILSRLGNTPREISLGEDGQLFVTDDHDAIEALIIGHDKLKSSSFMHKLETNSFLILFALAVTIVFGWGTVTYGVPASAKFIANKLPESTWEKWGSSLDVLDETVFESSDIDKQRQQEILQLITPYLEQYESLNPKLNFRSGMEANALALPSGDIVFTDDFVDLVEDDKELLAVFFHEVGHLKYKHIVRRTLQDSMITLLIVLITGDVESFDLLVGLPAVVLDLSYSREFEREADAFALEQLHAHDISVDYFSSVMKRLEGYYIETDSEAMEYDNMKNEGERSMLDYLSTHPGTDDRIRMVRQFKIDHGLFD